MRRTDLVAHCLSKPGGPYLNKQLWSRIDLSTSGGPDDDEARELIDDSYDLIVASLPKAKRPA